MKYFPTILATTILAFGSFIFIASAQNYTPLAPLPIRGGEVTPAPYDMATYLSGAIKLLLAIGASLAILMTVIGGTQYVAAGISPDAKGKAKDMITNAFIGLALMLVSYLILNSINPKLVQFDLSLKSYKAKVTVVPLVVDEGELGTAIGSTLRATSLMGCQYALGNGIACVPCLDCSKIPPQIANKQLGLTNKSPDGNFYLQKDLLAKLLAFNAAFPTNINGLRVTESWPPTSDHIALCHQNGGCFDINNANAPVTPDNILIYYRALKKHFGDGVVYENRIDCAPYIARGITPCKKYPTMTSDSSFHINNR